MAGINIFTDLLVLILPMKPAMQLNASRRKRCHATSLCRKIPSILNNTDSYQMLSLVFS